MNITEAQWLEIDGVKNTIRIVIDNREYFVPISTGNRHYNEVMKQVADKKLTIKEAD